jgi:hypothetical protein
MCKILELLLTSAAWEKNSKSVSTGMYCTYVMIL